MRFNNGMFGACICVLALLGTAIGGFVLNVDQDTREVTKYDFIADVSGLFSYSDAPEYIDYSPSTNYTGYSPLGSVNYTSTNTANNYRYQITAGTTSYQSPITITDESEYAHDYGNFTTPGNVATAIYLWNGTLDYGSTMDVHGKPISGTLILGNNGAIDGGGTTWGAFTKLTNIINDLPLDISDYESIELIPTQTGDYPVLFYGGSWERTLISAGNLEYNQYYAVFNENNTIPDKMVFDTVSNVVTAYRDGQIMWRNFSDNVGALFYYDTVDSVTQDPLNPAVDVGTQLSVKTTTPGTYGYMQPTAGVTVGSGGTWSNGYENGVIDLKVTKNGDNPGGEGWFSLSIGDWDIEIEYWNGFYVRYGSDYIPGSFNEFVMGQWLAIQIRIDALSGNIIFTPTNNANLMETVEPTDYSRVAEGILTPGDTIESLHVGYVIQSLKFQVTGTKVFLNTYNTVMIDPSLEISDYFPDLSNYRLNFYSFALIGDSMTINGQTCLINKDNATITFTNVSGFEYTKKLENLYITFNDGNTQITFVNDNSSYDLGETVSTTISFSGMWYFTTGLYEIVQGFEEYWDWDLSGFQATSGECLILFLAIIGVGIVVYTVYGKGKLGIFDWLVIGFAVFIGSAFLGF